MPDTSGSLFLHISSVPKINKTQFISSYVQEQVIHAKKYAAEGRAFERSWKQEEVQAPMSNLDGRPGLPQETSKLAIDIGFGTPVLKPREARRFHGDHEIPQAKDNIFLNIENVTRENEVLEKRVSKQKQKRKQRRSSGLRKGSSIYGSEKEYDQRLKERRERKRVKRTVMKPASIDDSLDESSAEGIKGKNKMTKKTSKNIGLSGLALMHGFTATNVGKGRLTVKPSLNVGVFNKGKASLKSLPLQRDKRPSKRAGHSGGGFIEDDFLGKTPKDLRKRKVVSGSHSETLSNLGSRTKAKKTKRFQKTMHPASNSVTSESSPSITENIWGTIKLDDKKPTESIMWDIERESAILPSHISTSISEEAISMLLDTKNISWSKVPVDLALHDVPLPGCQRPSVSHSTIPSDDTEPLHESPSIGPSESASQHANLSPARRDLPATDAASKYFASVPQSQPSEKLLCRRVTSELEIKEVVVIEPSACAFTPIDENHDLSLGLSSDVTAAKVQDEKKHAVNSIYDSLLHDLDDLPFVEPQDYKYSDYSFRTEPSEDSDCHDEVLQVVIPSYGVLDELDDERTHNENFFIHRWDVLENGYPQDFEQKGYEEQYHNQEESLDDHEYDASEYEAKHSMLPRVASEVCNGILTCNTDSYLEELAYHTGKLWKGMREVNSADNSSISDNLDTCINNDLEWGESADLIGTFAEGKALLRGYSEVEARAFYSSIPCRQIKVSAAEADVAKRLKNHWLPQRL